MLMCSAASQKCGGVVIRGGTVWGFWVARNILFFGLGGVYLLMFICGSQ